MDTTHTSTNRIGVRTPLVSNSDRREPASGSIRYVGPKEAKVPLPIVLLVFVVLAVVIVAVRHYVQS